MAGQRADAKVRRRPNSCTSRALNLTVHRERLESECWIVSISTSRSIRMDLESAMLTSIVKFFDQYGASTRSSLAS